jgi:hypothetical protein
MAFGRRSTQATSLIPLGDEWSAATELTNAVGEFAVSATSMSQRFPGTARPQS